MAKGFTTLVVAALVAYAALVWSATSSCACSPSLADSTRPAPSLGSAFREVARHEAASLRTTGHFLREVDALRVVALPPGAAILEVGATDSSYRVTLRGPTAGGPRRCTVAGHRREIGDSTRFTVSCVREPPATDAAPTR
jgi:hypothetical protein